jgi:hypothetical protein
MYGIDQKLLILVRAWQQLQNSVINQMVKKEMSAKG